MRVAFFRALPRRTRTTDSRRLWTLALKDGPETLQALGQPRRFGGKAL